MVKDVQKIKEGAIVIAAYFLLLFATLFLPFFILFLPLPFIVYVMRHGIKAGIVVFFVTLFGTLAIGGLSLLPLSFMMASGGLVAGELWQKNKPPFAVLLGTSLTYIANLLLFFVLSVAVFDVHPFTPVQKAMKESLDTASVVLREFDEKTGESLQMYYELIDMLPQLVPLIIVFIGIVYALVIQLIARFILKKMNMIVAPFPPVRDWTFPKSFLWYYLIILIVMLVGVDKESSLYIVVINLFPMLEIIMAIQGISFLFYYVYQKGMSKLLPIGAVILVLLLPPLTMIVRLIGIIDLGFNLRSRIQKT